MNTTYKHLTVVKFDRIALTTLKGPQILDEGQIAEIAEELGQTVHLNNCRGFILDFSEIRFMSSVMWGRVVHAWKAWKEFGGNGKCFILCGMTPDVFEVMKIMRLHKCFEVAADANKATEAISKTLSWRNS